MEAKGKVYTTPEAAKELGINVSHLRALIVLGQAYPTQQIGRTWGFTSDEIERLRTMTKHKGDKPSHQT